MTTETPPATATVEPPFGRRHRIVLSCPDRPGIVAAVADMLRASGANIVQAAQYSTDPVGGSLFMRLEFTLSLSPAELDQFTTRFAADVAGPYQMDWRYADASSPKRVAIMVSRYDHCLLDLLWRWRRGELHAEIPVVISNHPDLREDVEAFGLDFVHIPVDRADKPAAEAAQLACLAEHGPLDLVVLARYMQILSAEFLQRAGVQIINIHHSFLPSFAGAHPYRQARERGVKLVGATAHYVSEDLDAGPIIEQDVTRATHEHDAEALEKMGADIERTVFARAVQWHCEDRILVHGNRTVVF